MGAAAGTAHRCDVGQCRASGLHRYILASSPPHPPLVPGGAGNARNPLAVSLGSVPPPPHGSLSGCLCVSSRLRRTPVLLDYGPP